MPIRLVPNSAPAVAARPPGVAPVRFTKGQVTPNPEGSYYNTILADSPSLYWRLDEDVDAYDRSGNQHHGTFRKGGQQIPGGIGDGSGDRATNFGFVTSTYAAFAGVRTFEGWAYLTNLADPNGNALLGDFAGGATALGGVTTGTTDFYFSPAVISVANATWTAAWPGANLWVHWALIYDNTTRVSELFINGVSQGTKAAFSSGYPAGAKAFQIGNGNLKEGAYADEVAVYEAALTPAQILAHYNAGNLTYTDTATGTIILVGSSTRSASYADTPSGTIKLIGTSAESSSRSDTASGTITLVGSVTDSSSRSDAPSGTITLVGTRTESSSRSDTGFGTITLIGSSVESRAYPDTASGTITLVGSSTRSASYADAPSGTIKLIGASTESSSRSDTSSGTINLSGSSSASASYADARSGTINLIGTASESRSGSDPGSGIVALVGSASESASYADIASGTIKLVGSAAESYGLSHSDTGTGTITLVGSKTDSRSAADTGTGTVRLVGSSTESSSRADTATGTIKLVGSSSESWGTGHSDSASGTIKLVGTSTDSTSRTDATEGTIKRIGSATEFTTAAAKDDRPTTLTVHDHGQVLTLEFRVRDVTVAEPDTLELEDRDHPLSIVGHETTLTLGDLSPGPDTELRKRTLTVSELATSLTLNDRVTTLTLEDRDHPLELAEPRELILAADDMTVTLNDLERTLILDG